MPEALKRLGIKHVFPVAEQMVLDGDIQVGFVGSTDDRQSLVYERVAEDRLVLITPNTPRFAKLKERGVTDIRLMCLVGAPEGVKKIELKNPDGSHEGFAIAQEEGTHDVAFPHVYNIAANSAMKLHAKGSGAIEVLADGKPMGTAAVDAADFADVCVDLGGLAGEHDITVRMTGRITLDWFTMK